MDIKITHGYVKQIFEDGQLISQEFIAGDDSWVEDEAGEIVDNCPDIYASFEMVQP